MLLLYTHQILTIVGKSRRFKRDDQEFVCDESTAFLGWNTCHLSIKAPDRQPDFGRFHICGMAQLFLAGEDAIGWTKRKCCCSRYVCSTV